MEFGLHIVVVVVVEHVFNVFKGLLMALISTLTHDVSYLRHCVF